MTTPTPQPRPATVRTPAPQPSTGTRIRGRGRLCGECRGTGRGVGPEGECPVCKGVGSLPPTPPGVTAL